MSSDSSPPCQQEKGSEASDVPGGGFEWLEMSKEVLWKHIKYISLVILVVQNAALVLTMRYSRIVSGEKMYLASTAVVLTEIMKFFISISVIFYNSNFDAKQTGKLLYLEIIVKGSETMKVSVPSILYTIQNNLLYVALTHLNAVTFQVTYQLKILTTAVFSVLLLKKSLNRFKWVSLIILMVAVALVQWPAKSSLSDAESSSNLHSSLIGLVAILLACVSSGFSGVYIERILKSSETSMWIRNIQLCEHPHPYLVTCIVLLISCSAALLSFFVGLFGVFVYDWNAIMSDGFLQGYSPVVFIVVTLQALGGIIVAVVMKYADNILKGFASSLSIILSSIVSFFLLHDLNLSWNFLLGTILVFVATIMYSQPSPKLVLPVTENKGTTNSKGF